MPNPIPEEIAAHKKQYTIIHYSNILQKYMQMLPKKIIGIFTHVMEIKNRSGFICGRARI